MTASGIHFYQKVEWFHFINHQYLEKEIEIFSCLKGYARIVTIYTVASYIIIQPINKLKGVMIMFEEKKELTNEEKIVRAKWQI